MRFTSLYHHCKTSSNGGHANSHQRCICQPSRNSASGAWDHNVQEPLAWASVLNLKRSYLQTFRFIGRKAATCSSTPARQRHAGSPHVKRKGYAAKDAVVLSHSHSCMPGCMGTPTPAYVSHSKEVNNGAVVKIQNRLVGTPEGRQRHMLHVITTSNSSDPHESHGVHRILGSGLLRRFRATRPLMKWGDLGASWVCLYFCFL